MADEIKIELNKESLTTLLRSNLSCFLGQTITQDLLQELVCQIADSIDYFMTSNDK